MTTPGKTAPAVEATERSHKDVEMLDLVEETKDPSKHYRWVRSRADEYHGNVARLKLLGYTPVLKKEGGVQTVVEPDKRGDGVIAIGDLILMECPRALNLRRISDKFRRNESLLESVSAETEEMAKEKGISLIKDADHNTLRQEGTR